MGRQPLAVNSFGGGIAILGAAVSRAIDELLSADGVDIGPRGALVIASDVSDYTTLLDDMGDPWSRLHGVIAAMPGFDATKLLAIGQGIGQDVASGLTGPAYLLRSFLRTGEGPAVITPQIMQDIAAFGGVPRAPSPEGVVVTGFSWPGHWFQPVFPGPVLLPMNLALVCIGAREGFSPISNLAFGCYVAVQDASGGNFAVTQIQSFSALGTGPLGDGSGSDFGTKSKQLYFRGVIDYNDHAFGWGFDAGDATHGDGPARVMFSNRGKPLKWGNDNQASAGDRDFTDSDAIVLGGAGEIVRGAIKIFGRLFFGTNKGLHYIAGFGRDSFLTDGFTPVMHAYNITGPTAMIEGPDKLLYGVSDQGAWAYAGEGVPDPIFLKLVDFAGRSRGYWDLIWTDPTRPAANYPGQTNQDLVWTAVDWDRYQVLFGIPWCNATAGYGYGEDTVVIKYHPRTKGFTRQVFRGVQYTAAAYARREGHQVPVRVYGTGSSGEVTIQRYGYQPNAATPPVIPSDLCSWELGPYAPFGPNGRGSLKRFYLTFSWSDASALPLRFRITTTWDDRYSDVNLLTIRATAPLGPGVDDLWLDTSLTDTNLGNGSAGAITSAFPAALLKRWSGTAWEQLPGLGSNGTKALVRWPLSPRNGTWVRMLVETLQAGGRFQFESLGEEPGGGEATA